MKDKNYKSSRGKGDGNLSTGLLGMKNGGGVNDYSSIMKAQKGGEKSMTHQQIKSLSNNGNNIETTTFNGSSTTKTSKPNPYSLRNRNFEHQKNLIKTKTKHKIAIAKTKAKHKIAKHKTSK
jgi:hypothetical protein